MDPTARPDPDRMRPLARGDHPQAPDVDDANLRYAEAAVIERRVKERRKRDSVTNWVTRFSILVLVAFNFFGWRAFEHQQTDSDKQRAALTQLVCQTLKRFIEAPPTLPRDPPALADLSTECREIQREAIQAADQ